MLVQNWMTTEVITVTPETSLLKIGKLMRDNSVRRLPVLDDKGHVVVIQFCTSMLPPLGG